MGRYIVLKRRSASRGGGFKSGKDFQVLLNTGNTDWGITIERTEPVHAAQLAADPDIEVVARTMPIALIEPVDLAQDMPVSEVSPGASWGIGYVGADKSSCDGEGVTMAVLDTGIDRNHPAFIGVDIEEEDFSNSGNGDRQGHGTHCAGTIFGRDVNGLRIGIARGVRRALVGKVLDDTGSGESEMIFRALHWALEKKANVMSMSLGFDFAGLVDRLISDSWPASLATSTALESYRNNLRMFDAIMQVLRANKHFGTEPLVVAAAGNESRREIHPDFKIAASLPAAAFDVVSVAAIDQRGRVAEFSNSTAVLSAPGVGIKSAWPGKRFHSISGTSMACPHVAGLAALWWQYQAAQGIMPTATSVKAQLLATLRRDLLKPEFNEEDFGQGLATAPE